MSFPNYCQKESIKICNDCLTPVSAYLKLRSRYSYSFLLESATQSEVWGRYSFIGLGNIMTITKQQGTVSIASAGVIEDFQTPNPAKVIDDLFKRLKPLKNLPPALGYLSYDLVKIYENIADSPIDDLQIPDFLFVLPEAILTFDHFAQGLEIDVYALGRNNKKLLTKELSQILDLLASSSGDHTGILKKTDTKKATTSLKFTSNMKKEEFLAAVKIAKKHIKDGDIFQVVISQRWQAEYTKDSFSIYRSLRHINPSPYLFYLKYPDFVITGSSPEVLIKKDQDRLLSRPIAGTRKRGKTAAEDKKLEADLMQDEKELAEHKMLVDLARNDLGRISKFGSVAVSKYLTVENYSHVKHIVSTVESTATPKLSFNDLLRAVFPAGTLSGAPKVKAMEIIAKLEKYKRCFYGGGVAVISPTGDVDACITIRSALFKDNKVYIQAGGGIVYDSIPEYEYNESLAKASAIFKAIDFANNF